MINREYIEKIKKKFDEYEKIRDEAINKGIKINRLSKSIIYSLIRGDLESANNYMVQMDSLFKELKNFLDLEPRLINNVSINLQEYVEAKIFYEFIINNRLPTHEELGVDEYSYVMGLMDVAGELYRKSVEEMLKNNLEFAEKARNFIYELYQHMLYMEFKNYEIRKKVEYVGEMYNLITDRLFLRKVSRDYDK